MTDAAKWTCDEVAEWLEEINFSQHKELLCVEHKIDGRVLLTLTETDLRQPPLQLKVLGDIKRLVLCINELKDHCPSCQHICDSPNGSNNYNESFSGVCRRRHVPGHRTESVESYGSEMGDDIKQEEKSFSSQLGYSFNNRPPQNSRNLDPEIWKTVLSFIYAFSVFLLTSFVMVVVHDRVPDMEKYPPLPDIFLDNVPYIPWAFQACEIIAICLCTLWCIILIFHKHRFILMRRMFSLTGTVYLLRCVTMLITSLSVPGVHLKCEGKMYGDFWTKLHRTLEIWMGMGMTISGVRTCGDYMFSGHTVCITLLNFFVTEYTSRKHLYPLHTVTWVGNMFGLFFILAAHEHYSIDVFVAFYISSRLFLYYHVLANNRSLMLRDKNRRRVWFPLFSFFESKCDGTVPNEYEWPLPSINDIRMFFKKKSCKTK